MIVHCCDRCCFYKKEIQPCRTEYRGIWAILMHKMMFPSEGCNSVSNGTFCEFRPFSVIADILPAYTLHHLSYPLNHFAYPLNHFAYPWGYAYPSLGTDGLER